MIKVLNDYLHLNKCTHYFLNFNAVSWMGAYVRSVISIESEPTLLLNARIYRNQKIIIIKWKIIFETKRRFVSICSSAHAGTYYTNSKNITHTFFGFISQLNESIIYMYVRHLFIFDQYIIYYVHRSNTVFSYRTYTHALLCVSKWKNWNLKTSNVVQRLSHYAIITK